MPEVLVQYKAEILQAIGETFVNGWGFYCCSNFNRTPGWDITFPL